MVCLPFVSVHTVKLREFRPMNERLELGYNLKRFTIRLVILETIATDATVIIIIEFEVL